jgi:hypothetical protein
MSFSAPHIRLVGVWQPFLPGGLSSSLLPQVLCFLTTDGGVSMQEETEPEYRKSGDGNDRGGGMLADPPVRGLMYHGVLYLGVMLVLLAVNLRMTPDTLWVQWIALLWGLLLIWNAWQVFSPRGKGQR